MKKFLIDYLAPLALAEAGVIHLIAAPSHVIHEPIHGFVLATIGVMQIVWAAAFLRWPRGEFAARLRWAGLGLSGGVVVLWLCTQAVAVPFSNHIHAITWQAVATLILELVALGALSARVAAPSPYVLATCAAAGLAAWGGGLGASAIFPQLGHQEGMAALMQGIETDAVGNVTQSSDAEMDDEYNWHLPPGFPKPRVPEENPMTAEKVELGRYLFYDERLSGNGTQSCASCHLQEQAFSDGRALPVGSTGESHVRNAQALVNIAYSPSLTWANPALDALEKQVLVPMFGEFPVELGITGSEEAVLARFREEPLYDELFAAAFPDVDEPVDFHQIKLALSSFVRTLISGNSPYDQFVYQDDKSALSESERRGMNLFLSERLECHHCHIGFNLSAPPVHENTTFIETAFQNNGLYNLNDERVGEGAYPLGNRGLFDHSGSADDMGRFRPPTLRNIELTAPYMHDGSLATLEEVVQHYADGGRVIESGNNAGDGRINPFKSGLIAGFEISEQEKVDLVNFLKSLTDEQFITDPRFRDPFAADEVASVKSP